VCRHHHTVVAFIAISVEPRIVQRINSEWCGASVRRARTPPEWLDACSASRRRVLQDISCRQAEGRHLWGFMTRFLAVCLFVIWARLCSFFILMSTMSLLAQQTATFSGTVTDSSKYPIEGASVTLRNTGSNEIRQSLTDSTGRYTFTLLQAGTFEVSRRVHRINHVLYNQHYGHYYPRRDYFRPWGSRDEVHEFLGRSFSRMSYPSGCTFT
jgi:Carboxypeptidase regulatory-like domain